MLERLRESNRLNITLLLAAMSLFAFLLTIVRVIFTGSKGYLYLNWNLFLAFVPWLISSFIVIKDVDRKTLLAFLVFSWLIFFPNSPYILTDLFHLNASESAPIWFDLVLVLTFAWTGLLFGFISLMDIENLLTKYSNKKLTMALSVIFLFIGGFGIYLGRFLRWNSWDIFRDPLGLFYDISERFIDPFQHPKTWGVTILLGMLLNMMYFSFRFLVRKK